MTIPQEMKEKIFLTIERQLSLKDFESWLYANDALSDQMNESVVLEAYAFNYNQDHALAQFSSALLPYFDRDEFLLWKITLNLREIIEGKDSTRRILSEFCRLGDEEFPFLLHLGYYKYYLDDDWFDREIDAIMAEIKSEANELLLEILAESKDPQFKISSFVRKALAEAPSPMNVAAEKMKSKSIGQKKWWKFWR
ncbi:hypothetical protein SAMN04488109_2702 [Chryseolinea serpens]|uniref:Uncharacterized protein n=2 Tax=Chryseolinea serpens TaxID=947013 RepID=A0A1M5P6R1_9BACT|nr:hypothetical protein SAMN04488109_2702 [Chryseolinea serpens]